jgi:ferredoxin
VKGARGHPILDRVGDAGFDALGWFRPGQDDGVPEIDGASAATVLLIGNAGPRMFARFASERAPLENGLDDWTRTVVDLLAGHCRASALYPFEKPPLPFLAWARRARCGHVSPLGLNIHPVYGLWHAFRAALLFAWDPGFPAMKAGPSPCDTCIDRPCLTACPVGAFSREGYDVAACARHLLVPAGSNCMDGGCLARLACPVGVEYCYAPDQMRFHMAAFRRAQGLPLEPTHKI